MAILCAHTGCNRKPQQHSEYCEVHHDHDQDRRLDSFAYKIEMAKDRIKDLFTDPKIKSLRSEIVLLRLAVERIFNSAGGDENRFIMLIPQVQGLMGQIERTVASCHKIELQDDQLLDQNRLSQICDEFAAIIEEFIPDAATRGLIADRLAESISANGRAELS